MWRTCRIRGCRKPICCSACMGTSPVDELRPPAGASPRSARGLRRGGHRPAAASSSPTSHAAIVRRAPGAAQRVFPLPPGPGQILADVVLDSFVRALDGFEAALAGVAPGRWDAPSPCEGWSAADVAGHVIGDLQAVKAFATWRDEDNGIADPRCAAGDDPVAEWRAERARMMAALDP